MTEPIHPKRVETLRDLISTCPESSLFISEVVIIAHVREGYGNELQRYLSRAVVAQFAETGIIGDQILRLMEHTEGDAARAFDILTIPEELERFRAINDEQTF